MTLLDELLVIERQLWRNDADVYAATYLPEAVLIFPGIGCRHGSRGDPRRERRGPSLGRGRILGRDGG